LSPRDHNLVTIPVLFATGRSACWRTRWDALHKGVQPSEASGLLAHLTLYWGWLSAVSALVLRLLSSLCH
jgi:alkylhydroperoxidase/carboxymuconolactone decarboxylase family protein YurZ